MASESVPNAAAIPFSQPFSIEINEASDPRTSIPLVFVSSAPLPSLCMVACLSASNFASAPLLSRSALFNSAVILSNSLFALFKSPLLLSKFASRFSSPAPSPAISLSKVANSCWAWSARSCAWSFARESRVISALPLSIREFRLLIWPS